MSLMRNSILAPTWKLVCMYIESILMTICICYCALSCAPMSRKADMGVFGQGLQFCEFVPPKRRSAAQRGYARQTHLWPDPY